MAFQIKQPIAIALATTLLPWSILATEKEATSKPYESDFDLPGSRAEIYKTVGDVKLKIYIHEPAGLKSGDRRPAIVFFFGGGWRGGTPRQFHRHCRYLATQGMVAMAADYRVSSRQGTKPHHCVRDGKSAIRWVRRNAKRLGVDPDRIAAGGGSAGGHVAACAGVLPGIEEEGADRSVSSVPNAMTLFNPALILAPAKDAGDLGKVTELEKRFEMNRLKLSPYHHIRKGLPPALILHGKADSTVPYATAEAFAAASKKAGNRCELEGYPEMPHGFFNFGRYQNRMFRQTVTRMHRFLASLGYVGDKPAVGEFLKKLAAGD